MKTRWKILIAAGIFLALMAASLLVSGHYQPANALENYKKSLRDKGEKLELSEVLPPPVPAEQNCVEAVQAAFAAFSPGNENIPNAMRMVAPGKAIVGLSQPDVRDPEFTNSWEEFAAGVTMERSALELLQQALERPKLVFPLDYKKGAMMPLPHLWVLKRSAQKLTAATVCDLHNGDTGSAATNIGVLLALVRDNQDEGILISQLVRIAMAAIGTSATWEFLQSTNATDAQLATLQKSWEQMEFIRTTEAAFVFEQAWGANVIEKLRASHHEFAGLLGGPSGGPAWRWPPDLEAMANSAKRTCAEVMWRNSWSFTQEIHSLQANQIILETLRHMKTNSFFKPDCDAMKSRLSALGITNVGEAFFRALDIPDFEDFFMGSDNLGSVVFKAIRMEAARRVVITAIALKRFQLQHGKLPEKISELAPEFLAAIPIDPFDGKPLRYRPNADGTYLLYCVGEDGVDDGGDPSLPVSVTGDSFYWQNNKARDWVWPQPATAAEIQFYYEEQAKKSR